MLKNHEDFIDRLYHHIIEISKGNCEIRDDIIVEEKDQRRREILGGLLFLFEDLAYQREQFGDLNENLEGLIDSRTSELIKANDELRQLTYTLSHDLKSPLRGIHTLSTFIEEDLKGKIEPDTQKNLNLLKGRVNRLQSIIDGILSFLKVGENYREKEEVDVKKLIDDILMDLGPGDKFDITIQDQFPMVIGDNILLYQIFSNLVTNAIKFNDKNKGIITINFEEKNDRIVFSVKDNGPGIDVKYQDKIFEVFQRLANQDEVEGTGIGLAIVKKILIENGEDIWVDSEVGKWTKFTFTWPKNENILKAS